MLHKKLFKLNSDGTSIQIWEMHIATDHTSYWTVSGRKDGKMVTSKPTAVVPKVKRSQEEQVLLEANSKCLLKTRKKYVEDEKDVGAKAEGALPGYSAMLAKKWEDQKKKIKFPCIVQPKLDGVRCLATKDGLFTRGRKPIEACQHVHEALKPFFEAHPDAYLDGELYTHEFKDDFEKIIKAVKKAAKSATEEDLEFQKKVEYHVYDCPRIGDLTEEDPFIDRMEFAVNELLHCTIANKSIRPVYTAEAYTEEMLYEEHSHFLQEGYEGTMVRNLQMTYKGSRSSELLKMKEFMDDEFTILGVNEGKGGLEGHAATFTMAMPNGAEFKAKLKGSFDRLKWIWGNPDEVIGKSCTVVYQGITNKEGVPRFPVAKDVRGLPDKSDWV